MIYCILEIEKNQNALRTQEITILRSRIVFQGVLKWAVFRTIGPILWIKPPSMNKAPNTEVMRQRLRIFFSIIYLYITIFALPKKCKSDISHLNFRLPLSTILSFGHNRSINGSRSGVPLGGGWTKCWKRRKMTNFQRQRRRKFEKFAFFRKFFRFFEKFWEKGGQKCNKNWKYGKIW